MSGASAGPVVVGLDGARRGWACATVTVAGGRAAALAWSTVPSPAAVLTEEVAAVGVDMPIGLPATGRRACDLLAKARLGRAHARVFLAPPRAVLDAGTHAEGNRVHRGLVDGKGLSVQTWHLLVKVAQVDRLADPRLVEVHPELSFAALAGRVLPAKRTPAGRAERIAALTDWAPQLTARTVPGGTDHLDALVAAWSAWRWTQGAAEVLPPDPPRDECDRPMRMVV